MKAGIVSNFTMEIPFSTSLPMIHEAGFEAISIGARLSHINFTTQEGIKEINSLSHSLKLTIDSIHAPIPEGNNLFSLDKEERIESLSFCKLACDAAAEIKGRQVVVLHLIPYTKDRNHHKKMEEEGKKSIESLIRYAEKRNVKLALENGQNSWYDETLSSFLDLFNSPYVGFCYDSGHENVQKTCYSLLQQYGNRLFAVHIHDNEGTDTHLLPYDGNMNWDSFKQIFHNLNYTGNLILETTMRYSQIQNPFLFLAEARIRADRLLTLPTR